MMRNASLVLGCLALPVTLGAGCATLSGARGGGGAAETPALGTRNQALAQLETEALKPCATKGTPKDHGLFLVTAKADGKLSIGATQWLGSDELKACMVDAIGKAQLPPWTGPSVTWLWPVGTNEAPAPKPLDEPPVSYKQKQMEHVQRAQGNNGMGSDTSVGPLSACAQRSIAMESYALVTMKLFIFPDGKVAGSTPVANEGEGKDAAYMDCLADVVREWTFDPFQGPAFTTLDVALKFGVNPAER